MPTSQLGSRFEQQSPIESANSEAMCAPIQINHVHYSLSYQQATYHKHIGVVINCLVAMALTGLYPHMFLCGSALESKLESADSSTESATSSSVFLIILLGLLIGYFFLDKLLMNEVKPQCWKTRKIFNKMDHLMLHICSPMSNRKYTEDMCKARWRQNFMLEVLINVRLYASSSPQVCDYLAIATGGNTYDSYYLF